MYSIYSKLFAVGFSRYILFVMHLDMYFCLDT
jgi:hypothetical protein